MAKALDPVKLLTMLDWNLMKFRQWHYWINSQHPRLRVGHVTTSALVNTGATISVLNMLNTDFLSKLNPRSVKYMKPDGFKIYCVGSNLPMK